MQLKEKIGFPAKIGWLFWLPLALLLIISLAIPFAKIFFYSFTDFNVIQAPSFIGMQNYFNAIQDPILLYSVKNTLFLFVAGGAAILLIGFLLGGSAAKLPLPVGIMIGCFLGIGFLLFSCPSWMLRIFSGDTYGLINGKFFEDAPVPWLSQYPNTFHFLQLIGVGIPPAYWIFFIGFRSRKRQAAWHVAVCTAPVVLIYHWYSSVLLTGFPSADYQAHWLPSMIFDYGEIRFEVGYSCALMMILTCILVVLLAAGNLSVWGISCLIRYISGSRNSQERRFYHWIGGGIGICFCLAIGFLLLLIMNDAFRPIDELFIFPPRVFVKRPTLDAFSQLFQIFSNQWMTWADYEGTPLFYFAVSMLCYAVFVIPSAVGIVFWKYKHSHVIAAILLSLTCLMPLVTMSYTWNIGAQSLFLSTIWIYISNPLFPLSILLTAWVFKKGTEDSTVFSHWIVQSKPVICTAVALTLVSASTVLPLLYALQPSLYQEELKSPLQRIVLLSSSGIFSRANIMAAAILLLTGAGMLFLLCFMIAVIVMESASKSGNGCRKLKNNGGKAKVG